MVGVTGLEAVIEIVFVCGQLIIVGDTTMEYVIVVCVPSAVVGDMIAELVPFVRKVAGLQEYGWRMEGDLLMAPSGGLWFSASHLDWSPAEMADIFTRRGNRIEGKSRAERLHPCLRS